MNVTLKTFDEALARATAYSRCDRKPQTIWKRQTGEYVVTSYRPGDEDVSLFVLKVDARSRSKERAT